MSLYVENLQAFDDSCERSSLLESSTGERLIFKESIPNDYLQLGRDHGSARTDRSAHVLNESEYRAWHMDETMRKQGERIASRHSGAHNA